MQVREREGTNRMAEEKDHVPDTPRARTAARPRWANHSQDEEARND